MESFIQSYGIGFAAFHQAALHTGTYMAGSAALALYLKQEGLDLAFEPTDIDLYVRGDTTVMRDLLMAHGFEDADKFDLVESPYATPCITSVRSYVNQATQEIQLITLEKSHVIVEYIASQFDLSICATWWEPVANEFYTMDETSMRNHLMYMNQDELEHRRLSGSLSKKTQGRLAKYCARGFTTLPRHTATWRQDTRQAVTCCTWAAAGLPTAFDVWQYEEVNCALFLKQSPHHILLRIQEAVYAFDRHNLFHSMNDRYRMLERGMYVFQTPLNHSVSRVAMTMFLNSELSVYELTDAVTRTDFRGEPVTIYTVRGYPTSNWLRNRQAVAVAPYVPLEEWSALELPPFPPVLMRQDAVDGLPDDISDISSSTEIIHYDTEEFMVN